MVASATNNNPLNHQIKGNSNEVSYKFIIINATKNQKQGYQVPITSKFRVIHSPSSITNENKFNKIKHSTFSYFLTLMTLQKSIIKELLFDLGF